MLLKLGDIVKKNKYSGLLLNKKTISLASEII